MQGIPDNLDPREVLDLYLTEDTTSQIAKNLGVRRRTLVGWLKQTVPDEWKRVQIVRALCRKEDGDDGIETARTGLALARAREQLKSGQWDLERLDSSNYGPKQEITHVGTTLHLSFSAPQQPQRTIEIIEQVDTKLPSKP